MTSYLILRVISKLLIPFIFLFALYVQFHGDYGPGGGFQAGVIFASGIVLYTLIFGLERAQSVIPLRVVEVLFSFGVILYASVGIAGILKGGQFLEYGVLAHDPVHGQHLGILVIELGVGITVTAVVIAIFFSFVGRSEVDAQ